VAASTQYCTFYLDGLLFGVAVQTVQEVLRYQEMTRVPLAPPAVKGLLNLRGQIVPAIDLRRRLEFGEHPDEGHSVNVVVRTPDGPVSLLVDEVGEVLEVTEDIFERSPESVRGSGLLRGAYKLRDRLLLSIDIDRVIQFGGEAGDNLAEPQQLINHQELAYVKPSGRQADEHLLSST
jgi:purine-binding chemotaxis protein CheW